MSNPPGGPQSMAHLADAARKLLPGPNDPPEPYWAIVGVTAHGDATGDLWGAEPRTVTLFSTRELGSAALIAAGMPSPEPQARTVRWEVRGLSRQALEWLQSEPTLKPRLGVKVTNGKVTTQPL